jgi:hypothetical protein
MKLFYDKNEDGYITLRAERERNGRYFSTSKVMIIDRGDVSRETVNLIDGLNQAMSVQLPLKIDRVNGGSNDGA